MGIVTFISVYAKDQNVQAPVKFYTKLCLPSRLYFTYAYIPKRPLGPHLHEKKVCVVFCKVILVFRFGLWPKTWAKLNDIEQLVPISKVF